MNIIPSDSLIDVQYGTTIHLAIKSTPLPGLRIAILIRCRDSRTAYKTTYALSIEKLSKFTNFIIFIIFFQGIISPYLKDPMTGIKLALTGI